MNSLKALIIDDEPLAHQVILRYCANIPWLEVVGQCHRATEAYTWLHQQSVDLLFLDIQMPKLQGLDFLRTLSQAPQVIITSAFSEYALEGYSLQVCDYLLKPFRFDRFMQAVQKAQAQIHLEASSLSMPEPDKETEPLQNDFIFIKVDKQVRRLAFSDIQYLESYGNYVKVWSGERFYLTPRTLSSFLPELPAEFVQVHKSFLIAKSQVELIEGNMIRLVSGQEIPIGKSYRQMVRQWYQA